MRKGRDGEKKGGGKRGEKKKIRMQIVATTSLPAVYRPNGYARTRTAGTPHARANKFFDRSTPSIRKVDDGKRKERK